MLYFLKSKNIKTKLDKNTNKAFVPTTILITVLLSVCSLVHAICSFFNVVVVFVFILHYAKGSQPRGKKNCIYNSYIIVQYSIPLYGYYDYNCVNKHLWHK